MSLSLAKSVSSDFGKAHACLNPFVSSLCFEKLWHTECACSLIMYNDLPFELACTRRNQKPLGSQEKQIPGRRFSGDGGCGPVVRCPRSCRLLHWRRRRWTVASCPFCPTWSLPAASFARAWSCPFTWESGLRPPDLSRCAAACGTVSLGPRQDGGPREWL